MAKLVDALCSGRSAARRAGSSPVLGTTPYLEKTAIQLAVFFWLKICKIPIADRESF
jgi:hypothetical protein